MKDKSLGADGQPKYFFDEGKANHFIERKKLGDTHHAVNDGTGKWEILPKGDSNEEGGIDVSQSTTIHGRPTCDIG